MDALLKKEAAHAKAAAAAELRVAAKNKPINSSKKASPKEKSKPAKKAAVAASSSSSKASHVFNADFDEDDEDEEDDEFAENGFTVPDAYADPKSDADAQNNVGRRVYLDGVPGKDALAGEIIGWNKHKKLWEVELDRRDERLLVKSQCLRPLDAKRRRRKPSQRSSRTRRRTKAIQSPRPTIKCAPRWAASRRRPRSARYELRSATCVWCIACE